MQREAARGAARAVNLLHSLSVFSTAPARDAQPHHAAQQYRQNPGDKHGPAVTFRMYVDCLERIIIIIIIFYRRRKKNPT